MVLVPDRFVTVCPFSLAGGEQRNCIGNRCAWFASIMNPETKQVVRAGCVVQLLFPIAGDLRNLLFDLLVEVKKHGT